jgi:hypothetical protein
MESQDTYMRVRDVRFRLTGMRPGIQITAKLDDKVLTLEPIKYDTNGNWSRIPTTDNQNYYNPYTIKVDGTLEGCFKVPENITCGTKLIQFFDDEDKCAASAEYTANGKTVWTEVTRNYIRTWTAVVSTDTQTSYSTKTNTSSNKTKISSVYRNLDPIAESFYIDSPNGIMLESIDLFFAKRDENVGVELIIVECENGYPSQTMVPFSRVTISPNDLLYDDDGNVVKDSDGNDVKKIQVIGEKQLALIKAETTEAGQRNKLNSFATNFKFESPLYLYPETEYAFIVIAQSYEYELYTSTLGKPDLITGIGIKEQPYIGSMFKSQNLRTWTAEQMSDIAFNIYKYEFSTDANSIAYFDIVPLKNAARQPIDFRSAMQTLSLNAFVPSQTEIKYFYSWDNNEWTQFNNKEDIFNDEERSTYVEDANTDYQYLRLRCELHTEDKNISPMIDLEQVYGVFTNNQCEEIRNARDEFIEYDCGSYVSVPIKLESSGEDLRVILDAILPRNPSLDGSSRIAVSYKTTPIIQYYFNTSRYGCGSNLSDDDIEFLKNKEVLFYNFDGETMTKYSGESRCVITEYASVPEELVGSETIDNITTKYTSNGRLYVRNVSNQNIIASSKLEKDDNTKHIGSYVLYDETSSSFDVIPWERPTYIKHDVVIHNNKMWININENVGIVEPTANNKTYWTTVKNVSSANLASVPTHDASNSYVAWSLVKDDNGYYYISITNVASGQQLNAEGAYWRKVNKPVNWCYPQGTYVFHNNCLWKCVVTNGRFDTPTDDATSWKKIHCVKLVSILKTKEDSDWCEMVKEEVDKKVSSIDVDSSFKEYTYVPKQEMTGDFTSFSLKIDMFSQDKVNVPRVKDLRAIALI